MIRVASRRARLLGRRRRESKLLGKLELTNAIRPAARPGIAFVGDAALCGDPFWGIGCGWAFQSAEWLVDETADAVVDDGADLDGRSKRYRWTHLRRLVLHHLQISDFSSGRPANAPERLYYRAGARNPEVFRAIESVAARESTPLSMLTPRNLIRAALS